MRGWVLVRLVLFSALVVVATLALAPAAMASWTVQQLTENTYTDQHPVIDGGQVVWGGEFETGDIYFYDIAWELGTAPLRIGGNANVYLDPPAQIDAGQVVWTGQDGEIYFYDSDWEEGTAPLNLSNSGVDPSYPNSRVWDERPQIDAGKVVWQRQCTYDDGLGHEVIAYKDICFYDTLWAQGTAELYMYAKK